MTLKNFSFKLYRENLKRRSWVCLLSVLSLLLILPVRHAMQINGNLQTLQENPNYAVSWGMTAEEWLKYRFVNELTADYFTGILIAGLAILFAAQGFCWMNNSRKLDLYLSVPVSAAKRYRIIYLNGVLFFAVSYLASLLLTVLTAALMGAGSGKALLYALFVYLGNMVYYLAAYNLTLIAVMLTGKVLVTLCGTAVLFGYEYLVRLLYDYLRHEFFRTYSTYSNIVSGTVTSPFYTWLYTVSEGAERILESKQSCGTLLSGVAVLAVQALVYGLAAWILYRKRGAEAAGKAMAFSWSKPIIRFALVIPSTLCVGLWFWNLSVESILFAILGLLVGLLISHGLIQVIYEADIRSVLQKKWQLLVAGAVSAALFAGFYLDLTGYDTYIPETDEISEIAVAFQNDIYTIRIYDNLFEKNMSSRSRTEYMIENMAATDSETKEAVRALAALDMVQQKDQRVYAEGYIPMTVKYTLKNGREVYRGVMVENESSREYMDVIFEDEQFRLTRYQILDSRFLKNASSIRIACENGLDSLNFLGDNEKLIQAYAKELESYNFSMIQDELPLGMLRFRYYPNGTEKTDDYYSWSYPVYAGFTETIDILSENGAWLELSESGAWLETEDVVSITLTCRNLQVEDVEANYDGSVAISYNEDRSKTETFYSEKDIEAILPALYPEGLTDVAGNSMRGDLSYNNYEVTVAYNTSSGHRLQNMYFIVIGDRLPDYVRKMLTYQAD